MLDGREFERIDESQATELSPVDYLSQWSQVPESSTDNSSLPQLHLTGLSAAEQNEGQPEQNAPGVTRHDAHVRSFLQAAATDLGHRQFGRREAAQRLLEQQGLTSVAPLSRLLNSPDLEVARRAELALGRIMDRATPEALVACRTEAVASSICGAQLGAAPTEADLAALDRHVSNEIAVRLSRDPFRGCGEFCSPPPDFKPLGDRAVVDGFDRLATPAGQVELDARIRDLRVFVGPNASIHERDQAQSQLDRMTVLTDPARLQVARINARIDCGARYSESRIEMERFALQTYGLCANEEQRRNVAYFLVCRSELDESPQFMQRLGALDPAQPGTLTAAQMVANWRQREPLRSMIVGKR